MGGGLYLPVIMERERLAHIVCMAVSGSRTLLWF